MKTKWNMEKIEAADELARRLGSQTMAAAELGVSCASLSRALNLLDEARGVACTCRQEMRRGPHVAPCPRRRATTARKKRSTGTAA